MIDQHRYETCLFLMRLIEPEIDLEKRNELLLKQIDLQSILSVNPLLQEVVESLSMREQNIFYQIVLLDAEGELVPRSFWDIERKLLFSCVKNCIEAFAKVDHFYAEIGGILGYYLAIFENAHSSLQKGLLSSTSHFAPPFYDFRGESAEAWKYAYQGLLSLPTCSEFYVVGGAGDRLNLVDRSTKEPKPVASLRIFEKSLLEWLFDDLDGREYLYFRVTGRRASVPIVLMTSDEKNNDQEIERLCIEKEWFHRTPQENLLRIVQPLVPLIDSFGDFVVKGYFQPILKPGGHGTIWKLAADSGVYEELLKRGVSSIIVRQINNPISGMDMALCTLPGQGVLESRSFGFVSCPMKEGLHEGLNLLEKRECSSTQLAHWSLSNVEYVAFAALKKSSPELFLGEYPANVNLLFADISAIREATALNPFPGLIVNYKNEVEKISRDGSRQVVQSARLESTMQNISESFSFCQYGEGQPLPSQISTFIQLHKREKILSATKRSFDYKNFYETPLSFLYDWVLATRELLEFYCTAELPSKRESIDEFIQKGPEFYFLFHPSLGPFWSIIGQKLKRIVCSEGSFLNIGIPEVYLEGVSIDGSCRIESAHSLQELMNRSLTPKVFLKNVKIENRRSPIFTPNGVEWKNLQGFHIHLIGQSEVWIEDVTIKGDYELIVPDGMRAIVTSSSDAECSIKWEEISSLESFHVWESAISWNSGEAPKLEMRIVGEAIE
ncbi:MAG: UTP--glucose-1-phosphate uridylyltransferase [Chlamydia sp.]